MSLLGSAPAHLHCPPCLGLGGLVSVLHLPLGLPLGEVAGGGGKTRLAALHQPLARPGWPGVGVAAYCTSCLLLILSSDKHSGSSILLRVFSLTKLTRVRGLTTLTKFLAWRRSLFPLVTVIWEPFTSFTLHRSASHGGLVVVFFWASMRSYPDHLFLSISLCIRICLLLGSLLLVSLPCLLVDFPLGFW